MSITRKEGLALAAIVALFLILTIALINQGTPLNHDESVYALRARHFVDGIRPGAYWSAERAPGLPFTLQAAWLIGGTEPFLRLVTSGFGVLLILATWWIGRTLFDRGTGLIAAIGVAITPTILMASNQVWPDIPGAAMGLLTLAVYNWAVSREEVSPWVLAVAPLAFITTLMRFGAPVPIAIGLIGLTIYRWRACWRSRWLVGAAAAMTTLAVVLVVFVPPLTGNVTAPLVAIRRHQAGNAFPWHQGFTDYADNISFLVGGVVGMVFILGIVAALVGAARRDLDRGAVAVSLGIGVATVIAIALVLHGESRYLSPAYPWMWMGGGAGLLLFARGTDRVVAGVTGALVLATAVVGSFDASQAQNRFNEGFQTIETAATRIDASSKDGACTVITGYVPQVGWYSDCVTKPFNLFQVEVGESTPQGEPRFLFVVERGKRQPEGALFEDYLARTSGLEFMEGSPQLGPRRYVEVWRLAD
jgi:4-amino-4-deoxy-L-arabinose transferase-like glycosyltransferase